jgi:hypothetical protein
LSLQYGAEQMMTPFDMMLDTSSLSWQCQRVITLRMAQFAKHGPASPEFTSMISEKVAAFTSAGLKLATGTFPDVVMADIRKVVDDNVLRLGQLSETAV